MGFTPFSVEPIASHVQIGFYLGAGERTAAQGHGPALWEVGTPVRAQQRLSLHSAFICGVSERALEVCSAFPSASMRHMCYPIAQGWAGGWLSSGMWARFKLWHVNPPEHLTRYAMIKTPGSLPLRRSPRVNIGCPVMISGMLGNNLPFAEETRVVTISKHGAKLRTRLPLRVGMQLKIQPLNGGNVGIFKVVWVGREGTARAGEVGVECSGKVSSVLGVNFPY